MRVLVACEESQAVCLAFRHYGHEAYSCDVQHCSGGHEEWHLMADALEMIKIKWDLIIAHPPCTYLANVGARHLWKGHKLNQERYAKGMAAKEFFMRFYDADCPRICIENPVPSKVFGLPQYTQIVQPYMFGDPATKKTCLWLKGLQKLEPVNQVEAPNYREFTQENGRVRKTCWEMEIKGGNERQKNRAKTFPGMAAAMAMQWGGDIRCRDTETGEWNLNE